MATSVRSSSAVDRAFGQLARAPPLSDAVPSDEEDVLSTHVWPAVTKKAMTGHTFHSLTI